MADYDAALSAYGLGGVSNIHAAILEIRRVLRPNGVICFGEMTAPPTSCRVRRWIHKWMVEPWIKHFLEFRDLPLAQLASEAGFRLDLEEYYSDRLFGSMTLVRGAKTTLEMKP